MLGQLENKCRDHCQESTRPSKIALSLPRKVEEVSISHVLSTWDHTFVCTYVYMLFESCS